MEKKYFIVIVKKIIYTCRITKIKRDQLLFKSSLYLDLKLLSLCNLNDDLKDNRMRIDKMLHIQQHNNGDKGN